ncbi:hypothetical protein MOZ60_06865 [Stecheria sp. CLA-KB-P133]|uniref:Uncharacterized protein n=1 Tax=Grylomicrobium aquisgranensis TaxID=2926318 RepID=A0AB35U4N2_9FIRM|nr:hypothetical protein [Stecheria sp. CLA-KB-P133]
MHGDAGRISLNGAGYRRFAVFGRNSNRLESTIVHGQNTRSVDAFFNVGMIRNILWLTKQATDKTDVVNIEVHQGTTGFMGIKDWQSCAGFEGIIAV